MKGKLWLMSFGIGVALAACSETTGPPATPASLDRSQLHQLRWAPEAQPQQIAAVRASGDAGSLAAAPAEASVLDAYQVRFWALNGKDQSVTISYRDAVGSWHSYLTLTVPKDGLLTYPDGTPFAKGDSVLITVTIDTTALEVKLEPTGLTFNSLAPARLSMSYGGAGADLDADGVVTTADDYIEDNLLGVWVQERSSDPWNVVTAMHSLTDKSFTAVLQHFSGYAISW